jgi:hypothetical protein
MVAQRARYAWNDDSGVVSMLTKAMPEAISAAVRVLLKVCVGTHSP